MQTDRIVLALPTADRVRAHAYYVALGLETPGELADDGVPEPLQVVLNPGLTVMLVPTGGFGWVTGGRDVAAPGVVECQLSATASTPAEVDAFVERARAAGGEVVTEPTQQPWGYTATVADPDGHQLAVLVPVEG